jgi:hypothetical protein
MFRVHKEGVGLFFNITVGPRMLKGCGRWRRGEDGFASRLKRTCAEQAIAKGGKLRATSLPILSMEHISRN